MSIREFLQVMNEEDQKVALAVKEVLPQIEKVVKQIIHTLQASSGYRH